MADLIEIVTSSGTATEPALRAAVARHVVALIASAGQGKRDWVYAAERAVRKDPSKAFTFEDAGWATLRVGGQSWHGGRFEAPRLAELRERCAQRHREAAPPQKGGVRFWVLDGASPATDIGSLQATSGPGTLFQVASQFNCLESPAPYVTSVSDYFQDFTQGPRASISAFPGTLLRHYAAPGPDGTRFVQQTDGPQVELLADALGPGSAPNGYFTGENGSDPAAQVRALEQRFDQIRVGVHDGVEVALGYDWDGGLPAGSRPRIAQVFTSTVAGGSYGGERFFGGAFDAACRQLLRAAYLGTLLAAVSLGRSRVVLCLVGGGVFKNRPQTILAAIEWALIEVAPLTTDPLDIVLNGWNLGRLVDLKSEVLPMVRPWGGAVMQFDRDGLVAVMR